LSLFHGFFSTHPLLLPLAPLQLEVGRKEGYYKAVTVAPPITSPQTTATVQVIGGEATVRRRKWLEKEEEGVSKGCWYQGKDSDIVLLEWEGEITKGKISKDGNTIALGNSTQLVKVSVEEANKLNLKDCVLAPPSPYLVGQSPGRFVFLSGPPGAGKSSIAAWMAANANYVYYDGDGFLAGVNPYTPSKADEPTLATQEQHPLVGPGMHERVKAIEGFGQQFNAVIGDFSQVNVEDIGNFFFSLYDDIITERKRLGGNWVVAFAIPDIASRDILRSLLGPELVFVVLELSPELQASRLEGRHEDDKETAEQLEEIFKVYQPAEAGERAAISFRQSENTTIEENAKEVLLLVDQYYSTVY